MSDALRDAQLNPDDDRLHQRPRHQHAAGRQGRDAGHQAVFGEHAYKVSISSTKSQLGHLLGASGGVELVLCMQALRDGVIPPTINYDDARSGVRSRLHAQHAARAQARTRAMSNSFGFGGHNASIIARRCGVSTRPSLSEARAEPSAVISLASPAQCALRNKRGCNFSPSRRLGRDWRATANLVRVSPHRRKTLHVHSGQTEEIFHDTAGPPFAEQPTVAYAR